MKKLSEMSISEMLATAQDGMNLFIEESEDKPMKTKTQDAWEESKHPRDNDGKFSSGNGGAKSETSGNKWKNFKPFESAGKWQEKNQERLNYIHSVAKKTNPMVSRNHATRMFRKHSTPEEQENLKKYEEELSKLDKLAKQEEALHWHRMDTDKEYAEEMSKRYGYDEDLKTNGASGQDTAPEQEEAKMDKREVVREIMAIAAKPENFKNTYEFEQVADLLRRFGFAF